MTVRRCGIIAALSVVAIAAITIAIAASTELSSPPTRYHPKGTPWSNTHT